MSTDSKALTLHLVLKLSVLSQAFLALTFDFLGIISGRIALVFSPLFQVAPWILALYPPILSVRGNVGGIFSGNLSTMLHTGEAEPRLRHNTREFYSLIKSTFLLIFLDTLGIGFIALIVNFLLGFSDISEILYFMVVPPITCILAMALALPIASFIGIAAFKKGFDPDILLYPAVSTIDDVVVTICYVLVASLALIPNVLMIMSIALIVLGIILLLIFLKNRGDRFFMRVMSEGGPMILLTSFLGTFGGIGLASMRGKIEENPSILILYPALIDTLGDTGSVIGSIETTKLALGYTSSFRETLKGTVSDLISVEVASAFMHVLFGLGAFILGRVTGLAPDLPFLMSVALISNLLSFLFISVLSLFTAIQTFKRGLDPDNFVIPLVTSVSDFGATFALIAALSILRA